jgi:hypothetical protein
MASAAKRMYMSLFKNFLAQVHENVFAMNMFRLKGKGLK